MTLSNIEKYDLVSLKNSALLKDRERAESVKSDYDFAKMFISLRELDQLIDDLSPFFNVNGQVLLDRCISKFSNEFKEKKFWSRAGIKYELQKMLLCQLDDRMDVFYDEWSDDQSGI
jgi:hypothetical protein